MLSAAINWGFVPPFWLLIQITVLHTVRNQTLDIGEKMRQKQLLMCELYNCILDVQCHLKLWMTCQIWTYKVHEECQILGHEGALGLPDVVFFKFCCTVLKSSTNCTTWALWDRSDFWFSAILAASVFSFSMAAWSWEYSLSDISTPDKNTSNAYVLW